jgi:hypothetical protein
MPWARASVVVRAVAGEDSEYMPRKYEAPVEASADIHSLVYWYPVLRKDGCAHTPKAS